MAWSRSECVRILATVPDDQHLRIMVGEAEIHAAVAEKPGVFEESYWGMRLACGQLRELLTEAWLRMATQGSGADSPHHPE